MKKNRVKKSRDSVPLSEQAELKKGNSSKKNTERTGLSLSVGTNADSTLYYSNNIVCMYGTVLSF